MMVAKMSWKLLAEYSKLQVVYGFECLEDVQVCIQLSDALCGDFGLAIWIIRSEIVGKHSILTEF